MGIKDNFSQAVKELWKRDGQEDSGGGSGPSELDRYLARQNEIQEEQLRNEQRTQRPGEFPSYQQTPAQQGQNSVPQGVQEPSGQQNVQPRFEQEARQAAPPPVQQQAAQNTAPPPPVQQASAPQREEHSYYRRPPSGGGIGGVGGGSVPPPNPLGGGAIDEPSDVDETTIISKNTIIDGNVRSLANMQVNGSVKGNVETTRNIEMSGRIVGDITCNNANLNSAAMQGNAILKGKMRMDRDTILMGDLTSQYADINGRIRGKLEIAGKAELKRDAIVFGDINASTIAVTDGAIIQGYVNTTFLSQEDSRNMFPDAISLDTKE